MSFIAAPFFSQNKAIESESKIQFIYVFRNNNTNTVRKYDLDGNLISTLSNSNANYASTTLFSVKEDDGVIYGTRRSSTVSATIIKLNPDLTFSNTSSISALQDITIGPNCLFVARSGSNDRKLESRAFSDMSLINASANIWGEEDRVVIFADPYSNNLFLANDATNEGFRSFDKTNTTITQNYFRADGAVNIRDAIFTHPDYPDDVWISNSSNSRRYKKDNSAAGVALTNLNISTRDVLVLSNGNLVYGLSANLICRTIANADANSTTNVFSIGQGATILSLCKDDDDNIYVITASNIRKYTSSGTLVWTIGSQSNLTYIVSNKF
jgi:hypothetical protein